MINFAGSHILLDIEGTTSSVSFVFEVMFPYARKHLAGYLSEHWDDEDVQDAARQIAVDDDGSSLENWLPSQNAHTNREHIVRHLEALMDADSKATGLKQLQGILWRGGFLSGELKSHLYDDVLPALLHWRSRDIGLLIYSSGSVHAQQLFFENTISGDLLPLFLGHYDTTIGNKREMQSYQRIVEDCAIEAEQVLFLSDIVLELDAAAGSGLQTGLVIRPENAAQPNDHGHPVISSFTEISLD